MRSRNWLLENTKIGQRMRPRKVARNLSPNIFRFNSLLWTGLVVLKTENKTSFLRRRWTYLKNLRFSSGTAKLLKWYKSQLAVFAKVKAARTRLVWIWSMEFQSLSESPKSQRASTKQNKKWMNIRVSQFGSLKPTWDPSCWQGHGSNFGRGWHEQGWHIGPRGAFEGHPQPGWRRSMGLNGPQ